MSSPVPKPLSKQHHVTPPQPPSKETLPVARVQAISDTALQNAAAFALTAIKRSNGGAPSTEPVKSSEPTLWKALPKAEQFTHEIQQQMSSEAKKLGLATALERSMTLLSNTFPKLSQYSIELLSSQNNKAAYKLNFTVPQQAKLVIDESILGTQIKIEATLEEAEENYFLIKLDGDQKKLTIELSGSIHVKNLLKEKSMDIKKLEYQCSESRLKPDNFYAYSSTYSLDENNRPIPLNRKRTEALLYSSASGYIPPWQVPA